MAFWGISDQVGQVELSVCRHDSIGNLLLFSLGGFKRCLPTLASIEGRQFSRPLAGLDQLLPENPALGPSATAAEPCWATISRPPFGGLAG
jgi:hypothetical protein